MKESVSSFLSNVLSVILGIAITFAVQGMIDRSRVRKDVRSALKLIRTELQSNRADIATMADYLDSERAAAKYFLSLDDGWTGASSDSVGIYGGILLSDASIALSDDALQLLKMSSLFQSIGNDGLSMKIIHAYDTCELIAAYRSPERALGRGGGHPDVLHVRRRPEGAPPDFPSGQSGPDLRNRRPGNGDPSH